MAKVKISANVQSKTKSGHVGEKSLKSERTYQLGIVYKDIYGRETPVFTNSDASFTVPKRLSDKRNSIITNLENDIPSWVDTFKFFVKETSNEYYNACMDRWYDAEDGNIWLSFPSAERNKIKEDGFIILKKQAVDQSAVYEEARYKVVDIQNEAPEFIKIDFELYGTDTLRVSTSGALPGAKKIKFKFTADDNGWFDSVFFDAVLFDNMADPGTSTGFVGWPLEDVVIKLSSGSGGSSTKWLDVANMYKTGADGGSKATDGNLFIELSKTLPGSARVSVDDGTGDLWSEEPGVMGSIIPNPDDVADITVKLAKKVAKNKAEFDGKFFVKIRRDATIDERIRSVGVETINVSVVESVRQYYIKRPSGANTSFLTNTLRAKTFWQRFGENWFIDESEREEVGAHPSFPPGQVNYKGPFYDHNGFGIIGDDAMSGRGSLSIFKPKLESTLELTLNVIKDYSKDGYDISGNSGTNQNFFNLMSTKGTKFRWKEDPYQHIYEVTNSPPNSSDGSNADPQKTFLSGLLNYSSYKVERKKSANKAIRLYVKFKTTGWRLDTAQGLTAAAPNTGVFRYYPEEEVQYPFNYKNQYTPPDVVGDGTALTVANSPTDLWDPTKRGYGEYQTLNGDPEYNVSTTPGDHPSIDVSAGANTGVWESIESSGGQGSIEPTYVALGEGFAFRNHIEIIDMNPGEQEQKFTKDPAIWETEPREDVGLDIYYEASQAYPVRLTDQTNELFAPYGCTVTCEDKVGPYSFYMPDNTVLYDWAPTGHGGDTILLNVNTDEVGLINSSLPVSTTPPNPNLGNFNTINGYFTTTEKLTLRFTRPDGSYTTAKANYYSGWSNPNTGGNAFINPSVYTGNSTDTVLIKLDRDISKMNIKLPYFNCYSFGNGVESDRIRDDFNAVTLGKGVKASTVLDEPYEKEQRANGLIYSGIYNSTSGINNLNQFIAAEKITKDVPPSYGSIQKLKARDATLVAFCEDKVLKIQAYKDALYKADGNPDIISTNKVLGDITTFAGEFGISKNPESFAEESFRMYFTDKQRGKVLRLSGDGITPISSVGMKDFFADNLKLYDNLIGSFDDRKGEYNLTMTKNTRT